MNLDHAITVRWPPGSEASNTVKFVAAQLLSTDVSRPYKLSQLAEEAAFELSAPVTGFLKSSGVRTSLIRLLEEDPAFVLQHAPDKKGKLSVVHVHLNVSHLLTQATAGPAAALTGSALPAAATQQGSHMPAQTHLSAAAAAPLLAGAAALWPAGCAASTCKRVAAELLLKQHPTYSAELNTLDKAAAWQFGGSLRRFLKEAGAPRFMRLLQADPAFRVEHCANKKGGMSIVAVQLQIEVLMNAAGPAAADSAPVETAAAQEAPEPAVATAVRCPLAAAAAAMWPQHSGAVNEAKLFAAQLLLAAPAHTVTAGKVCSKLGSKFPGLNALLPGRKKKLRKLLESEAAFKVCQIPDKNGKLRPWFQLNTDHILTAAPSAAPSAATEAAAFKLSLEVAAAALWPLDSGAENQIKLATAQLLLAAPEHHLDSHEVGSQVDEQLDGLLAVLLHSRRNLRKLLWDDAAFKELYQPNPRDGKPHLHYHLDTEYILTAAATAAAAQTASPSTAEAAAAAGGQSAAPAAGPAQAECMGAEPPPPAAAGLGRPAAAALPAGGGEAAMPLKPSLEAAFAALWPKDIGAVNRVKVAAAQALLAAPAHTCQSSQVSSKVAKQLGGGSVRRLLGGRKMLRKVLLADAAFKVQRLPSKTGKLKLYVQLDLDYLQAAAAAAAQPGTTSTAAAAEAAVLDAAPTANTFHAAVLGAQPPLAAAAEAADPTVTAAAAVAVAAVARVPHLKAAAAALWPQGSGAVNTVKLAAAEMLLAAPEYHLDSGEVDNKLRQKLGCRVAVLLEGRSTSRKVLRADAAFKQLYLPNPRNGKPQLHHQLDADYLLTAAEAGHASSPSKAAAAAAVQGLAPAADTADAKVSPAPPAAAAAASGQPFTWVEDRMPIQPPQHLLPQGAQRDSAQHASAQPAHQQRTAAQDPAEQQAHVQRTSAPSDPALHGSQQPANHDSRQQINPAAVQRALADSRSGAAGSTGGSGYEPSSLLLGTLLDDAAEGEVRSAEKQQQQQQPALARQQQQQQAVDRQDHKQQQQQQQQQARASPGRGASSPRSSPPTYEMQLQQQLNGSFSVRLARYDSSSGGVDGSQGDALGQVHTSAPAAAAAAGVSTDDADIKGLLAALPPEARLRQALASYVAPGAQPYLVDIAADAGRPVVLRLSDKSFVQLPFCIDMGAALTALQQAAGTSTQVSAAPSSLFAGGANRLGLPGSLHRVSAMRDRQGAVYGLTYRLGRHVTGVADLLADVLSSMRDAARGTTHNSSNSSSSDGGGSLLPPVASQPSRSLLLLGRPGVGKTTLLRDVARLMSSSHDQGGLGMSVVVVDTSNEIAGDSDLPHPCIGIARRMMVPQRSQQAAVMIEAVTNHTPEVIIVDEIATSEEAAACRTIAARGVLLVSTAHGSSLSDLLRNPDLLGLVGGVKAVTLGDRAANRNRGRKTCHERGGAVTFGTLVELLDTNRWRLHPDVSSSVDTLLSHSHTAGHATQLRSKVPSTDSSSSSSKLLVTFESGIVPRTAAWAEGSSLTPRQPVAYAGPTQQPHSVPRQAVHVSPMQALVQQHSSKPGLLQQGSGQRAEAGQGHQQRGQQQQLGGCTGRLAGQKRVYGEHASGNVPQQQQQQLVKAEDGVGRSASKRFKPATRQ